ncbi:mannan endo-1,6-alpha-mannosidase [Sodiomyces alkalinus F11]|uniref:Mannan endo-1,6-alpha-mannosidase n=1 Tax=Sodiomyces alkalinus (strain CBS 110278 / VKM F-3762 / F11) TaxID=1314773 RepID=A0A3N2PWR9_SODAK|nr:mannan endo-1,6-alpha-mannosidase [Sodiomyces alkalinus F11]ROT38948.1 mannan endo-1,6-alpha-mannosidase [Sodiomyces alkalinus F11]
MSKSYFRLDTPDNIRDTAQVLGFDLMNQFYHGNESGRVPGLLPDYHYWFYQGGVLMDTLIDYWHFIGDDTYNDIVTQGILHQVGPSHNFIPRNQSDSMANDDQCVWSLAAMSALEYGLPSPGGDHPQWFDLATNVFNDLAVRFDTDGSETCGGGLPWQFNRLQGGGFHYKSAFTNGCFFDLASRLATYTGNETYAEYAGKTWDWMSRIGLIDPDTYVVYQGAHTNDNCSDISHVIFSHEAAIFTHGAAFMYNYTNGSDTWRNRVEGLSSSLLDRFFPSGTLVEIACEGMRICAPDFPTFKGLAHRWLGATPQVAPFAADSIRPLLRTSAQSAVDQCTGGETGRQCGFYWESGEFVAPGRNELDGAAEQMSGLAAVLSLLADGAVPPATGRQPNQMSRHRTPPVPSITLT